MSDEDNQLAPVLNGLRATYRRRLWVVLYAAPTLGFATWMVTWSIPVAGVVFGITMTGAMILASRMSGVESSPLIKALVDQPERIERLRIDARSGGDGGIYVMFVYLEGKGRYALYLPSRQEMEDALEVFHSRCPGAVLQLEQPPQKEDT